MRTLSKRQFQVLRLLAKGRKLNAAAGEMHISVNTANSYLDLGLAALKVPDPFQALWLLLRDRILKLSQVFGASHLEKIERLGGDFELKTRNLLVLIASGYNNEFIAESWGVSERTLSGDIAELRAELGIVTRIQFVPVCFALGLKQEIPCPTRILKVAGSCPNQKKLLGLLVDGNTNKEAARKLGIGASSVAKRLSAVMQQHGLLNRYQLIRFVLERNLVRRKVKWMCEAQSKRLRVRGLEGCLSEIAYSVSAGVSSPKLGGEWGCSETGIKKRLQLIFQILEIDCREDLTRIITLLSLGRSQQ